MTDEEYFAAMDALMQTPIEDVKQALADMGLDPDEIIKKATENFERAREAYREEEARR